MARIPLRARDGSVRAYAIVDDADFEWLNQWHWCLGTKGYVIRRARPGGTIRLARLLMGLSKGDPCQADHVNRDKLDNRRSNLRIATNAENNQNVAPRDGTSRFRGVYLHAGRWRASVRLDGKLYSLGQFDREEDAAHAAARFRREHMPFSVADVAA